MGCIESVVALVTRAPDAITSGRAFQSSVAAGPTSILVRHEELDDGVG